MPESIAKKVFYSIGDACNLIGVKPHVLRYWETQFPDIRPMKNRAGNRVYKAAEIELVFFVRQLLYMDKHTIEEARGIMADLRGSPERAKRIRAAVEPGIFAVMRADLNSLRETLQPPSEPPDA